MPKTVRNLLCTFVAALALLGGACKDPETPTSTTPTTTTTVALPIFTEEFAGSVPVSGSTFYSFTVTQYGTVNITLASVSGAFVPSTVTLGLGIGVPSAEFCATTVSISTSAGSTAQLTGTYAAGVYCVRVSDVGNLFAPAKFTVAIAFP